MSNRATFVVIETVPKTLNEKEGGRITRAILCRFGDREDVRGSLYANFGTEGFLGHASDHYRRRREQVSIWRTGETNPRVARWLEEYLESLDRAIQDAVVDEERED